MTLACLLEGQVFCMSGYVIWAWYGYGAVNAVYVVYLDYVLACNLYVLSLKPP